MHSSCSCYALPGAARCTPHRETAAGRLAAASTLSIRLATWTVRTGLSSNKWRAPLSLPAINLLLANGALPSFPPFPARSAARHRFIMKGGVIMRLQAGRRHYRSKKSKNALRRLKGLVPLHKPIARKLKKLGFKRTWWHMQK